MLLTPNDKWWRAVGTGAPEFTDGEYRDHNVVVVCWKASLTYVTPWAPRAKHRIYSTS